MALWVNATAFINADEKREIDFLLGFHSILILSAATLMRVFLAVYTVQTPQGSMNQFYKLFNLGWSGYI